MKSKPYRWQVKVLGYYWRFYVAPWSEWHGPNAGASMRRAWWWLWHWHTNGRTCLRICGVTLHSKSTPYVDYSEYGA